MHPLHAALLTDLHAARSPQRSSLATERYLLSGHEYLGVPVPVRRSIARAWIRAHAALRIADQLAVIESLYAGDSHEEKTLASLILGYAPQLRAAVSLRDLERWLGRLQGWAEVDALCSGVFTADEVLSRWPAWSELLLRLAASRNPNKRRAALVFLVRPVRGSADARVLNLALRITDLLANERSVLITKAISWLLRSGVGLHGAAIAGYLADREAVLPAIALRETRRKLATGRK